MKTRISLSKLFAIVFLLVGLASFTLPKSKEVIKASEICWVDWTPSDYGMCRPGNEGEIKTKFEQQLEADATNQEEKQNSLRKSYRVYFICGTLTIVGFQEIPFS